MTTATDTATDTILSDKELALLNEARTLLETLAKRCSARAWDAETDLVRITRDRLPTGADYGSVQALADSAAHAIFSTLNWTNSHKVQPLTDAQLHNRKPEPTSIIPPALVPVGHEDYPEVQE